MSAAPGPRVPVAASARSARALCTAAVVVVAGGCEAPSGSWTGSEPDSGVVHVGGAALPYVIEGTGRPCLVMGSRVYYPRTFSDRFKSALRCAYVDHRGFVADAPPPPRGSFTIDAAVEEFEAARRPLGLERFVLVGHSIHGLMALAYALRYPQHVSHLIAIGAPPARTPEVSRRTAEYWETQASPQRKATHEQNRARLKPDSLQGLSPSEAFVANYVANAARYWADPTYDAGSLWRGVVSNSERTAELFERSYELRADAPPVSVPVLVALGRHDYAVPPVLWDEFTGPFRDVTVAIFEGSGHTPQLEEPEEFDRRVFEWLNRN